MLDELIKEINELKEYKRLYESQKRDKKVMSDKLYELMIYKYNNTPLIDRVAEFRNNTCTCCRFKDYCDYKTKLSENIMQPIESDKEWIPATVGCDKFKWD